MTRAPWGNVGCFSVTVFPPKSRHNRLKRLRSQALQRGNPVKKIEKVENGDRAEDFARRACVAEPSASKIVLWAAK